MDYNSRWTPLCFRDISPGSQQVSSKWRVDWLTYMASNKGYVIVLMDVSGSGASGDKTRKSVHRRLTLLESQDVLHIIRWATVIYFPWLSNRKTIVTIKIIMKYYCEQYLNYLSILGWLIYLKLLEYININHFIPRSTIMCIYKTFCEHSI